MTRRVFGKHEYERRKLFGWPIYSPKVKPKPKGLSGYLSLHSFASGSFKTVAPRAGRRWFK